LWIAIASLVVGLIFGAISAWIASRGSREPRRILTYGVSATPLLSDDGVADVEVRRAGVLLHKPNITRILVAIRGNVDIRREHFDNLQPLKVHLGAKVIDILGVDSSPTGIQAPDVVAVGSSLHIGPGLLSKNHELTIAVLVDGEVTLNLESPISGTTPRRLDDIERQYEPVLEIAAAFSSTSFSSLVATSLARVAINLIRR
jgi:hypothetical protein